MSDRAARVDAFMVDLDRLTETQVALFESGDVGVWRAQRKVSVLPENQGDVEIASLAADEPGCGWGGTVLKLVTALADRHGIDVFVRAHADEESDSIPQPELEAFYAAHGFVDVGSWDVRDMIRRPVRTPHLDVNAEAETLLTLAFAGEVLWTRRSPPAP